MKSISINQSLEVPLESRNCNVVRRGLLRSVYKEEAKQGFSSLRKKSLFSLRQNVRTNQYISASTVGTLLKVSVFVIGYLIAFA